MGKAKDLIMSGECQAVLLHEALGITMQEAQRQGREVAREIMPEILETLPDVLQCDSGLEVWEWVRLKKV